jgi:hypothetical protein
VWTGWNALQNQPRTLDYQARKRICANSSCSGFVLEVRSVYLHATVVMFAELKLKGYDHAQCWYCVKAWAASAAAISDMPALR